MNMLNGRKSQVNDFRSTRVQNIFLFARRMYAPSSVTLLAFSLKLGTMRETRLDRSASVQSGQVIAQTVDFEGEPEALSILSMLPRFSKDLYATPFLSKLFFGQRGPWAWSVWSGGPYT